MKPPTDEIREIVARALAEDLGSGDATSEAIVPEEAAARATIFQKQPGVLFGFEPAAEAFRQAAQPTAAGNPDPVLDPMVAEGQWRDAVPAAAARVAGSARALLAGERTALNLLGHLSGIATLTARFVEEIRGTGARLLDTRKTTPGLRALEKAAVAAGGGSNHRMGLYDAILIKENHAALAGGVGEAVRRAREARPDLPLEVECRDEAEVLEAIRAGAGRLLLDNMDLDGLRAAAAIRDDAGEGAPSLEASGGITLDNVAAVAAAGVDFISVGALTHSAPSLDVSLELKPAG
ncbi:MAG: nicotinate-nucleotide pyrophosphorylase [Solirubrobacterales bacterium]|jgi:nicotinate-nucleotide pyrophosphorylase (carboxylating)|nr:nicotinate-nucleotide pyrophosphorylase [Solirubrobacterales bacterium]